MSKTIDEEKALKKLGIADFRHITKDKVVELCNMLPKMDPEVAKKALEQFPEFVDMSKTAIEAFRNVAEEILKANETGNAAFYSACDRIMSRCEKILDKPDLPESEQEKVVDKMMEVVQLIKDKDAENKQWLAGMAKMAGAFILVIVAIGAAVIDANFKKKE